MTRSPLRRRRLWSALMLAVSVLAALLWARLKLVTGLPRTAYADPEAPRKSEPPQEK